MTPFDVKLARKIRTKRAESGLTARALALRMGVNPGQVYSWENCRYSPAAFNLCLLADEFGCTVDELLGRGDDDG